MAKEIQEPKCTVILGDINTFYGELLKFKAENIIKEKFISSQMAQMPNPNYIKAINGATQPEFITGVIISAVIFFEPKKVDLEKK